MLSEFDLEGVGFTRFPYRPAPLVAQGLELARRDWVVGDDDHLAGIRHLPRGATEAKGRPRAEQSARVDPSPLPHPWDGIAHF